MSGSLLLIAVVWIVLLAPLLLRNQSPVRRTAKALTETRVLHEGGASLNRRKRLQPAADSFQTPEVDEELELVEAEPEFFLIEDEGSRPASLKERTAQFSRKRAKAAKQEQRGAAADAADGEKTGADAKASDNEAAAGVAAEASDVETVDAEIVEPNSEDKRNGASADADKDEAGKKEEVETIDGEVVSEASDDEKSTDEKPVATEDATAGSADATARSAAKASKPAHASRASKSGNFPSHDETDTGSFAPVRLVVDAEDEDAQSRGSNPDASDSAAFDSDTAEETRSTSKYRDIPAAYFRGSDLDTSVEVDEAEVGVEKGEKEAAAQALLLAEEERRENEASRDELDAEDMEYLASRRGRGVFDPVASRRAAVARQKRRKQVLTVLLVLCVITGIAGPIVGGMVWIATALAFAFTALYLYFLRRSALEEARTRQRRIARMRRARLGVRNTEDTELGVPDRLRRPGAFIVESDDADPEFEHLDYIDSRDFFDNDDEFDGHDPYGAHQRIHAV